MDKGLRLVYDKIHARYELVNHLITFGLDSIWRRKAAAIAMSRARSGRWIDMCTGTGEMAERLQRGARANPSIIAYDYSMPMLSHMGERRDAGITAVAGDASSLPFKDEQFDLMTISFATRNLLTDRGDLVATFQEFRRVLKKGGVFVHLETSQPRSRIMRKLRDWYILIMVKRFGRFVAGSKAGFGYLAHSMMKFYDAPVLEHTLTQAGFSEVTSTKLLFGVAAIHVGVK